MEKSRRVKGHQEPPSHNFTLYLINVSNDTLPPLLLSCDNVMPCVDKLLFLIIKFTILIVGYSMPTILTKLSIVIGPLQ